MIAAWQKTHNDPPTGYLTGPQSQALLREAAPAIAPLRRRGEEARGGGRRLTRKRPRPRLPPGPYGADAAAGRGAAAHGAAERGFAAPRSVARRLVARHLRIARRRATAASSPCTCPDQRRRRHRHLGSSRFRTRDDGQPVASRSGSTASRFPSRASSCRSNQPGLLQPATMIARYDGANTITGTGPEANSGGRTCTINLDAQ